jgi:hypothetical protein
MIGQSNAASLEPWPTRKLNILAMNVLCLEYGMVEYYNVYVFFQDQIFNSASYAEQRSFDETLQVQQSLGAAQTRGQGAQARKRLKVLSLRPLMRVVVIGVF